MPKSPVAGSRAMIDQVMDLPRARYLVSGRSAARSDALPTNRDPGSASRHAGLVRDTLIEPSACASPPGCVTLHAARVGGGAAAAPDLGGGGEAAFRPGLADLDEVAAPLELVARRLRHAAFHHHHARARGAGPERR